MPIEHSLSPGPGVCTHFMHMHTTLIIYRKNKCLALSVCQDLPVEDGSYICPQSWGDGTFLWFTFRKWALARGHMAGKP